MPTTAQLAGTTGGNFLRLLRSSALPSTDGKPFGCFLPRATGSRFAERNAGRHLFPSGTKGAATFTAALKLGEGTWKINGCPHDGGTLVALGGGRFGAVAQRSGEIFAVSADNKETMLGKGRQAVAVGGEGQITVVWNDGSDLVAVRDVRQPAPTKVAADARFPIVVSVPGKGQVLAYERGDKGATSIAVERL